MTERGSPTSTLASHAAKRGRSRDARSVPGLLACSALLGCATLLGGCESVPRVDLSKGDFARGRDALARSLSDDRSSRNYMLSRLSLGILHLADGYPRSAEIVLNETFDVLRTQGINADKTVASIVFSEGVRFWKGEPFEQALAFHYVAVQKAMMGEWDNARAAASSSLFLLQDFGVNERGESLSTLEIAQRAVQAQEDGDPTYLDKGYQPIRTDFALGYVMTGLANQALGRIDEANDNYARSIEVAPSIEPVVASLRAGGFNTVLVVDAGEGPAKRQYGPHGSLARFEPVSPSRNEPLAVEIDSQARPELEHSSAPWPVVEDVNRMARDHKWNNMEDVRQAKATVGTALLATGIALAASGGNDDDGGTRQVVGLALAGLGGLMMAGAGADTRHCEVLPQRTYLIPLSLPPEPSIVRLFPGRGSPRQNDAGQSQARFPAIVLRDLSGPRPGEPIQLRYVRLASGRSAPAWALSERLFYANDFTAERVPGDELPFILGGSCVRRPSPETMRRYHEAGFLLDMTSNDLANLYRDEGIQLDYGEAPGVGRSGETSEEAAREAYMADTHVLEGGRSLIPPLPGSAGYQRLFCQRHRPYEARSDRVRELARQLRPRADPSEPESSERDRRRPRRGLFGKLLSHQEARTEQHLERNP
ncbi:MAG: hypothetical protein SFZ23_14010 [Planctomycetota bacterium]|nr:hypothetical protein [Planctomycetota bacterium]